MTVRVLIPSGWRLFLQRATQQKVKTAALGCSLARQQIQNLGGDPHRRVGTWRIYPIFVQIPWDSERNIA